MKIIKRYFIALPVSGKVQKYLCQLQKHLNDEFAGIVRWISPSHLHMTLQFLGNLVPEVILQVHESMSGRLPASFILTLQTINIFCHRTKPKILFVQTSEPSSLTRLVACVRAAATEYIVVDNEIFIPHITLGRFCKPTDRETVLQGIRSVVVEPLCWEIDRVTIYSSEQTDTGLIYPIVHSLDLA